MSRTSVPDCKRWLSGNCLFGDRCRFKHDPTKQNTELNAKESIPKRQDVDCSFWLKGKCKLENNCWYRHDPDRRGSALRGESTTEESPTFKCSICLDTTLPDKFPVLSGCIHRFHADCISKWRNETRISTPEKRTLDTCPECRTPIYFVVLNNSWATNKAEHDEIIGRYLKYAMQKPCQYFNEGIASYQQNEFQERFLYCPHGNRCHHAHILPNTTRRFWFSTDRIREMILKRTQLRQREARSSGVDDVDDIIAANERIQQAFSEIDAIANQLSSQELLRRYQEVQMQELTRRTIAQREAVLGTYESRPSVGPYENW